MISDGGMHSLDLNMVTRSGVKIPARFEGFFVRDSNQRVHSMMGVFRDMRNSQKAGKDIMHEQPGELEKACEVAEKAYQDL